MDAALVIFRGRQQQVKDDGGGVKGSRDRRQPQGVAVMHEEGQEADLQQQVDDADAHGHLRRPSVLAQVRVLVGARGVVGGADADEAHEVGQPQLFEQGADELWAGQREGQPVAAGLQLRDVRVALRVVDELVVGQVLQAVVVRAAEQGQHAEEVRGKVVEVAVAEEDVVNSLMGQAAQLVLAGPHEHDGHDRHGNVPGERQPRRRPPQVEGHRPADDRGEEQVRSSQVIQVRPVVRSPQLLQPFLQLRVLERLLPPGWKTHARHRKPRQGNKGNASPPQFTYFPSKSAGQERFAAGVFQPGPVR